MTKKDKVIQALIWEKHGVPNPYLKKPWHKSLTMEEAEKLRREWNRFHMIGRMGTPTEPEKGLLARIIGWMRRRKKERGWI